MLCINYGTMSMHLTNTVQRSLADMPHTYNTIAPLNLRHIVGTVPLPSMALWLQNRIIR